MAEKTASFAIRLDSDVDTAAREDAAELEKLRKAIFGSQDAIKQMGAALKSLRGQSDEVKSAKEQLKAKIEAERNVTSALNLQLLKVGTTYEKLASHARASAKGQKDMAGAAAGAARGIKAAGGPVAELGGKLGSLRDLLQGGGGAFAVFAAAAALTVAAVAGLVVGIGAAGIALTKFIIGGANAARAANLVREAASGSAENAANLGTQVDALARKLPTPKDKLNDLAAATTRALSGTRVSGQGIVDTYATIAEASSAMGDEVGSQLGEIVKRGKNFGRLQINPFELQGTGINFTDVAKELSTQMGVSVKEAQAALFEGRVKIDDGAKALRATVEKRFGSINARKLLDLDVIVQKFHERLAALTSGVNLEPFLKGLQELADLFGDTTVSGAALKDLVTLIGNDLVGSFGKGTPIAKVFIKQLIIGALQLTLVFYQTRNAIRDAFKGDNVITMANALGLAKVYAQGLADAFILGAKVALDMVVAVAQLVAKFDELSKSFAAKTGGESLGGNLAKGVANGLTGGVSGVVTAAIGLAGKAKNAIEGALGIHSPSKVGHEMGLQMPRGMAMGMEAGAPEVQAASDALVPTAPPATPGKGASNGRGGPQVIINFSVDVQAGGSGESVAKALSEPSFLAQFTKVVEDALLGQGVPTQTPV